MRPVVRMGARCAAVLRCAPSRFLLLCTQNRAKSEGAGLGMEESLTIMLELTLAEDLASADERAGRRTSSLAAHSHTHTHTQADAVTTTHRTTTHHPPYTLPINPQAHNNL